MSATLPSQAANGGPPGTPPRVPNPTYGSAVPNVVKPPAVDCPDTLVLMLLPACLPPPGWCLVLGKKSRGAAARWHSGQGRGCLLVAATVVPSHSA